MASEHKMSRRNELERLFQKYSDVPKEVIFKEDVLREGLAFTPAALEYGATKRTKLYGGGLFTFDYVKPEEAGDAIMKIPDLIAAHGGLYDLRNRLQIRVHLNPSSPYMVDMKDGELLLCERDNGGLAPLAPLFPYPEVPEFWSKYFEDGTPWKEIARDEGGHRILITPFVRCQHWGPREECKFCDINENARAAERRGELHLPGSVKKVEHVVEVLHWLFFEEGPNREPHQRPWGIELTGGAITKNLDGCDEDEFYLRYVRPIRERLGHRPILLVETSPRPREIARRYRAEGVDVHDANMEIWDKRLFGILCPGKERVVGRDNWLRMLIDEVDVFGVGSVCSVFVQGAETAKPWGLSEAEALKSSEECFEFLMSHGVIPRPITWFKEPLSQLRDASMPSVEYYIQIDRIWFEKSKKHGLPAPLIFSPTGPGLGGFPGGAHMDMQQGQ